MMRRAVMAALLLLAAPATAQEPPVQGWTPAEREVFRGTAVGARLLPLAWFRALEDADGALLAARPERWGFLPGAVGPANPEGLPVGLVRERAEGGPALGMSCAACHTRVLRGPGGAVAVDGAGSEVDAAAFVAALQDAVAATAADEARFGRFAERLGTAPADRAALRTALGEAAPSWPVPQAAGPGRFAMLGTAPVRNAALWGTWRYERGFVSGSVPNEGSGWLAGYAIQVMAVAGPQAAPSLPNPSLPSPSVPGLLTVAALLRRLEAPSWPSGFPAVVERQAAQGRTVFAAQCAGCHVPPAAAGGTVPLAMVAAEAVGTDPAAAAARVAPDRWEAATAALGRFGRLAPVPKLPAAGRPAYRAAPLAGIWAQAPYLHDGSVPSLRALLDPPAQRGGPPARGAAYDPALLGFPSGPGPGGAGHDWGTTLPEESKAALLEFLKTM